jgi:hypothetical protein
VRVRNRVPKTGVLAADVAGGSHDSSPRFSARRLPVEVAQACVPSQGNRIRVSEKVHDCQSAPRR